MTAAERALGLGERPAWQALAACRGVRPALFFPAQGEETAPAKAVCASCPVRTECQTAAMANGEHYGIWGGQSELERKRLRRARREATRV